MPRYNNPKKTYRYGDDFKALAVELSHKEGVKVREVADGLGHAQPAGHRGRV